MRHPEHTHEPECANQRHDRADCAGQGSIPLTVREPPHQVCQ